MLYSVLKMNKFEKIKHDLLLLRDI